MKKLLSLILTLALLSTMLVFGGVSASAETGTKILVEKTKDVFLDDEIAHLVNGKEGNQYTSAGTYAVNNCTHSGTSYEKYLYLKADLTEFADKDIESVVLNYRGRTFKYNLNLYVSTTSSSWSADTITLDNAPASTSRLILAENTSAASAQNYTKDITSIVDLETDAVLSLKFEVKSDSSGATHATGVNIYNVGNSTGNAPRLVITYTEELDTTTETITPGTTFTFKGETSTEGAPVRLVVALYEGDTFLGAVASDVLTNGTDTLELPVDLSAYTTATKIKCYFWNGTTLEPFMGVTEANIAAAA